MGQQQFRMTDKSEKMQQKEAPVEAMRAKASFDQRIENNPAIKESETHVKGNPGRPV